MSFSEEDNVLIKGKKAHGAKKDLTKYRDILIAVVRSSPTHTPSVHGRRGECRQQLTSRI